MGKPAKHFPALRAAAERDSNTGLAARLREIVVRADNLLAVDAEVLLEAADRLDAIEPRAAGDG